MSTIAAIPPGINGPDRQEGPIGLHPWRYTVAVRRTSGGRTAALVAGRTPRAITGPSGVEAAGTLSRIAGHLDLVRSFGSFRHRGPHAVPPDRAYVRDRPSVVTWPLASPRNWGIAGCPHGSPPSRLHHRQGARVQACATASFAHHLHVVHEVDARQPVSRIQTLEAVRSRLLAPPRLTALLVTLFAAVAARDHRGRHRRCRVIPRESAHDKKSGCGWRSAPRDPASSG